MFARIEVRRDHREIRGWREDVRVGEQQRREQRLRGGTLETER